MIDSYRRNILSTLLASLVFIICCYWEMALAEPIASSTVSGALQKQLSSSREAGGIRVERITYAVGGMKLDLRYRVTDLLKAQKIFTSNTPVVLVDQITGTKLGVPNMPKVGKLRQVPNQNEKWRLYWMMFDNPGALVKKGGKVTLLIGDVKIKDIIVE